MKWKAFIWIMIYRRLTKVKIDVLQNRCSKKFSKIYRQTSVLESLFNKVVGLRRKILLKRESSTGVCLRIFRTFKKNLFTEHLGTTASLQYLIKPFFEVIKKALKLLFKWFKTYTDKAKLSSDIKSFWIVFKIKSSQLRCNNEAKSNEDSKLDSHLPKNLLLFTFIESPLKMMKNALYFMLKALFVNQMFTFLP